MDPIKKWNYLIGFYAFVVFTIICIFNILEWFPVANNRIVNWIFTFSIAYVSLVIFVIIALFLIERDVEKVFKKFEKKNNAKVFRKNRIVVFKSSNEIITWSYFGPRIIIPIFDVQMKVKKKLDFEIENGKLWVKNIGFTEKEYVQKRNEIRKWRSELKKGGIKIYQLAETGHRMTAILGLKRINLEEVLKMGDTIP